jgi:hypothetical protein
MDNVFSHIVRYPRITRLAIIIFTTVVGAGWLLYMGPMPVVRISTPLQEHVPWWYMLSAFPVLGMLLANLLRSMVEDGLNRKTIEFGLQLSLLVAIAVVRLAWRLPISGHALLFAYALFRYTLFRYQPFPTVELVITGVFYLMLTYLKLVWWTDPITLASGTLLAGILVLPSYVVKPKPT